MGYFRADAHIIAEMVAKDCLRYSPDNAASLLCLFRIESKAIGQVYIPVILFDDVAESVSRDDEFVGWYEIKGDLTTLSLEFRAFLLPKITVKAKSLVKIPQAAHNLFDCEVFGRLTANPEKVSKSKTFEFIRFSLAVNRAHLEQVNYFDFSVFKSQLMQEILDRGEKGLTLFARGEMVFFNKRDSKHPGLSIKLDKMIDLQKQS